MKRNLNLYASRKICNKAFVANWECLSTKSKSRKTPSPVIEAPSSSAVSQTQMKYSYLSVLTSAYINSSSLKNFEDIETFLKADVMSVSKVLIEVKLGNLLSPRKASLKSQSAIYSPTSKPYFYYKDKGRRLGQLDRETNDSSSSVSSRAGKISRPLGVRLDTDTIIKEKYKNSTNLDILASYMQTYVKKSAFLKPLTIGDFLNQFKKPTMFGRSVPLIVGGDNVNR